MADEFAFELDVEAATEAEVAVVASLRAHSSVVQMKSQRKHL